MTDYDIEVTESKQFRCISIVDEDSGEIQVQHKVRKDADLEDLAKALDGMDGLPSIEDVKDQVDDAADLVSGGP